MKNVLFCPLNIVGKSSFTLHAKQLRGLSWHSGNHVEPGRIMERNHGENWDQPSSSSNTSLMLLPPWLFAYIFIQHVGTLQHLILQNLLPYYRGRLTGQCVNKTKKMEEIKERKSRRKKDMYEALFKSNIVSGI